MTKEPRIGRTLAHYRITAAIGSGGMGEVYRATDTRLGREVALKVLDFGLAKLQQEEGGSDSSELLTEALTGVGTIVGTVPYMSPEQIEAKVIDHRTDIFSLGVLLYEMVTGERPFQGSSSPALMSSILKDAPPASSRSEAGRRDVPWIAVLPFGCPSGDAEIEAFADGLEDDVASGLSQFSYLFVVARKSARRYRGKAVDVRQVGAELGARYVTEGGIRRAGSRIRIGANLIDAQTGTHLWSETYDRDLAAADVFELQDEITDRVVAPVADPQGALTRSMALATDSRPPESLTSHEAVLRSFLYRQRIMRRGPPGRAHRPRARRRARPEQRRGPGGPGGPVHRGGEPRLQPASRAPGPGAGARPPRGRGRPATVSW